MPPLPEAVSEAWDERQGPAVFTTVDKNGMPNSVYVGNLSKLTEEKLIIADNYFHKTRANVLDGSRGALLFITTKGEAYQIKGGLERHTSGEIYDDMKQWLDPRHPGVAAVVLNVEEVYRGANRLL
ncbi:MAG: pyridoxamine 5'-phosphate oxidase family protein [Planctomycetota bacterium]|jgi:predicted pyridoxine 5'-phosphate oxidase superfamily flavin-nucleotide-binding protein